MRLHLGNGTCREENPSGSWQETDSPALTEEALAAFDTATDGLVGVDYVPVALLSTQVVSGTNYRIRHSKRGNARPGIPSFA